MEPYRMLERIIEEDYLELLVKKPYQHRITVYGTPITYVVIVGRKRSAFPQSIIS